jgi:hypothetical protein
MKKNIWFTAMAVTVAVAVVCVSGFILVDRLILHPPKDKPAAAAVSDAVDDGFTGNTNSNHAVSDQDLISLWSSEGASGEMVDPDTGFSTGSIYNGEWYLFREDGTFRYVIVSSGLVLDGGAVWEGKYSVRDGEIKLTNIKESWYPNPAASGQKDKYENKKVDNTVLIYAFEDEANTLIINDSDSFTRVQE